MGFSTLQVPSSDSLYSHGSPTIDGGVQVPPTDSQVASAAPLSVSVSVPGVFSTDPAPRVSLRVELYSYHTGENDNNNNKPGTEGTDDLTSELLDGEQPAVQIEFIDGITEACSGRIVYCWSTLYRRDYC